MLEPVSISSARSLASPPSLPRACGVEPESVPVDSVVVGAPGPAADVVPASEAREVRLPVASLGERVSRGVDALVCSTLSAGVPGLCAAPLLVAQGGGLQAEQLVDALVASPVSFLQRRVLLGAAEKFGLENLQRVVDGGVKLHLVEENPFSEIRSPMCASYTPDEKALRFPPARLDTATVLHELGHALDDVIEPDEADHAVLRSHRDEKLQAMYQDYCERVEGLSFWQRLLHRGLWSDYATTSPQEYLAEGVMDYTRSESTRRRLERNDPGLAQYVAEFLDAGPHAK